MESDLDLRVLAVIVDGGRKVFTLGNDDARRLAVFTPLADLIESPECVTVKIVSAEDDDELSADDEFEALIDNILHWITHA